VKIVISLGGSIFSKEDGIDLKYVKEFSREILTVAKDHEVFIVTGGGKSARRFIESGREFGAPEELLDTLGILATRLNALIISSSLGSKGLDFVPERVEETDNIKEGIFVMGGTVPGHSTDAVSAMLAVHIDADILINATNVDGVYEKDPKKNSGVKRFDRLSTEELIKIVKTEDYIAGTSTVIDPKAARIIHEKAIKTVVLDGRDVENIVNAINGKFTGTLIEKN
jgi:uridylate kinase